MATELQLGSSPTPSPSGNRDGPDGSDQVEIGLSMLAGAVLVKSMMDQKPMVGPFPRCPTCNGTDRVTCLCSRWSDGDVGCSTCSGSDRMFCCSCSGFGTGRPLPSRREGCVR
ncbi:hypothetical protein Fmac_004595 [Flemingia macrophylla]|uniref:Uncharacterized protein n=1 Tax=Flemingia macrophylla TaxID=520843 RepID=A0ABD1N806_9FABA